MFLEITLELLTVEKHFSDTKISKKAFHYKKTITFIKIKEKTF